MKNKYSIEYGDKLVQFESSEMYIPHIMETIEVDGTEFVVDTVDKRFSCDGMYMAIWISCHEK